MTIYNTGKVRIGLAYCPYLPIYHDADAVLLQTALLATRPRNFFERFMRRVWKWL